MKHALWFLLLSAALVTCGLVPAESSARQGDSKKGTVVKLDGLQSRTPADWIEEPPTNRMRFKQFRLPAVMDDKDNAELIIFFFGTGGGGTAEENIKRWKAMFVPPEGKKIEDVAKVDNKMKVGDVKVTYLDVNGTYLQKDRPFDPNSPTNRRSNYRMLGVVFESKNGPYFIRLVGPADTVAHYKKGFDQWLKGFK
jgi:hypothetical protein